MDLLTRDNLGELIEIRGRWCVSIYGPTHRAGMEVQQDSIRFGNLLSEAEQRLAEGGYRHPDIKKVLEPAGKLIKDSMFWKYQGEGLAFFLSESFFRVYRLPVDFEELVIVTDRFHVKPLLPLMSGDGRFFILALSQNEVRLLQGSRNSVSGITLENVPSGIADALKYDDPEKQLQYHTGTGGSGRRPAIFHGHGVGKDDTKVNILRYFRRIDEGLREQLRHENAPMVLAGVEYLLPIYREASSYRNIMDQGITGSPEEMSPEDLRERAWTLVRPRFQKEQEEAVARYRNQINTEKVSHDITKIVPAAYYGKIEILFTAAGIQQWGAFDPKRNVVYLHAEAEAHDEDLLDLAAVHTLVNGGTTYTMKLQNMPDKTPLAAIYRY